MGSKKKAKPRGFPYSGRMVSQAKHRVEVALPLPIPHTFTYAIKGESIPPVGTRVLVPFRRDERVGWITGGATGTRERVRDVLDVLEEEPSATPELLKLCRWIAEYYLAPLGLVLRAAFPGALSDSSMDFLSLTGGASSGSTRRETRLLEVLAGATGPIRVRSLRRALGMGSIWPEIRALTSRGLLRHETVPPKDPPVRTQRVVHILEWLPSLEGREAVFARSPRQREAYELLETAGGSVELSHLLDRGGFSRSVVAGLKGKGIVRVSDEELIRDPFASMEHSPAPALEPTRDQDTSLRGLVGALEEKAPGTALLHGVTGSGKTLVYIELLREAVLRRGRGAIVLVPEISLTPQTVSRFRAHFGDRVAVLHSALSDGERFDAWRQLRRGEKQIAVGARSAVFAPVPNLGVVVVDEEHDGSYKQSEAPRYHARDVAIVRAGHAGALCVLGSATPSLESWENARREKFRLFSLPQRVGGGALPPVEVVDLRKVWREVSVGRGETGSDRAGGVLSPRLVRGVSDRLARGEQVILLLNRRGYSNFVQCRECGEVWRCLHCSVSLTFHRATGRLLCHYCRHDESAPSRCERCGSKDLGFRGLGTEQVERVVAESFPGARIARMDVDTTSGKWSHHEILGRVERGEVDILLGTQMIAKGLDFPRVTLVGVVNADVGIHLPDFRASERTFQLLSQVAGRTGRGPLGGEVVVQTALPEHYTVRAALEHDFEAFAKRELEERREPPYPPYRRLANVVFSSPDPEEAAREAERGARWLTSRFKGKRSQVELVGPAPSPIEKLHGRWRWHFLLRSPSPHRLGAQLSRFRDEFRARGRDVRVVIDRDPVALL
ncbi:primosomal protein N' [Gemmatimonadota bacterium]